MTPSELKSRVEARGSRFFSRENMRFSGDSMRNYGVRSASITAYDSIIGPNGRYVTETVEVWELYRKRAVKHGLRSSAYFDKETFRQRFSVES